MTSYYAYYAVKAQCLVEWHTKVGIQLILEVFWCLLEEKMTSIFLLTANKLLYLQIHKDNAV